MRKKIIMLLVLIILPASLYLIFFQRIFFKLPSHKILCLGDSITENQNGGYAKHLVNFFKKNDLNISVISKGRPGNNSGQYLEYLKKSNLLLKINPKIILLMLGTNDVRIDSDKTSLPGYIANMKKIINIIKYHINEDGSKPRLILMTIPPVIRVDLNTFNQNSTGRVKNEIVPSIRNLAIKANLEIININNFFNNHPQLLPGIHPSKRGYIEMARFIYIKLIPFISGFTPGIKENLPPHLKGKIIFQSDRNGNEDLFLLTHKGVIQITQDPANDEFGVLSPDGKKVVFESNRAGKYEIYIKELNTQSLRKILPSPTEDRYPFWAQNNEAIFFNRLVKGKEQVFKYYLANKKLEQITQLKGRNIVPASSPDVQYLLITSNRLIGWHVYRLNLKTKELFKFSQGYGGCRARYSHAGDYIAWVSHKMDKKGDIFITPSNTLNHQRLTTNSLKHDYFPSFSPDDRYLVYASGPHLKTGNYNLMVIEIATQKTWQLTTSQAKDILPHWSQ